MEHRVRRSWPYRDKEVEVGVGVGVGVGVWAQRLHRNLQKKSSIADEATMFVNSYTPFQ
jgi:hypothetical protein